GRRVFGRRTSRNYTVAHPAEQTRVIAYSGIWKKLNTDDTDSPDFRGKNRYDRRQLARHTGPQSSKSCLLSPILSRVHPRDQRHPRSIFLCDSPAGQTCCSAIVIKSALSWTTRRLRPPAPSPKPGV